VKRSGHRLEPSVKIVQSIMNVRLGFVPRLLASLSDVGYAELGDVVIAWFTTRLTQCVIVKFLAYSLPAPIKL